MAGLTIPNPGITPAIDKAIVAHTGVEMQMPVRIGETNRDLWLLPFEPRVVARTQNIIVRRSIAKRQKKNFGSVKEVWTKDDYEIVITGLLYDHTKPRELPTEQITRLDGLCSLKKPLIIQCSLLEVLGASQVVVASLEWGDSDNIGYQPFIIRAYSDTNFNLLIEK